MSNDEMRAGKIEGTTYGQSVYDLAMEYVTDEGYDQNLDLELQEHPERYADDLAQTIGQAIDDWIEDRLANRPLLYKPSQTNSSATR